jgi:hypothetical protein
MMKDKGRERELRNRAKQELNDCVSGSPGSTRLACACVHGATIAAANNALLSRVSMEGGGKVINHWQCL